MMFVLARPGVRHYSETFDLHDDTVGMVTGQGMNVLILEDDIAVAELLNTVVFSLYAEVSVTIVGGLAEAQRAWRSTVYDLLICGWSFPDGKGLDLVKQVRERAPDLPVFMISGQTDRQRVLAAAHHHVTGFISKPVDVEMIRARLREALPGSSDHKTNFENFDVRLHDAVERPLRLPFVLDPSDCLALIERQGDLSVSDLATHWQNQPALTARLLDVANSSSFRRSGQPCYLLREAIQTLGVPMSLNQALALALDLTHTLTDSRLQVQAKELSMISQAVARTAWGLARQIGEQPARAYTAGLLHRLGELAVLGVAQQHLSAGSPLSDEELADGLQNWAAAFGNTLKAQWALPLALRDLIGATHRLLRGPEPRGRLMMRAAALVAQEQSGSEECGRLLRLIGIREPAT